MLVQKGEYTNIQINNNGKISGPKKAFVLSVQILYGCKCGKIFLITNIFPSLENKVQYCPYCGSSEKILVLDTLDLTIPEEVAQQMAKNLSQEL
jgi:DNA-directed RNA polymerase subunit RPC12/RpoP